ncbi:Cytochrome c-type biogenesis protein Ccs1/ResB [hydrothermal vent metagenome]|uniref:Cytochrome c-type biogenesis protein Ccs1/ResB n=1 Tax=hydrothermal vent metagenome TaxID=652676 RepID=A0A3B1AB47_9ZZZZ
MNTTQPQQAHRQPSNKSILLEFLGSMNLAISILVVLAIASIIGTVLQQNQPYNDYIIKFGPFWHEFFSNIGLYDVYSAVWFLILLGFLVLSTSVCVYRNTPTMLREMRQFRLHAKAKSLKSMKHAVVWQAETQQVTAEHLIQKTKLYLGQFGFQLRDEVFDNHHTLVAKRGGINRIGYILTHVGIVIICIGGLIDGNLSLKVKEWLGDVKIETRDILAKDVPAISRLKPDDSLSFRGSITLPEGSSSDFIFLNVRDGYLVQELPFAVELKNFRVEHYESGQPKSFESDLIIHDKERETFEATIAVNYPLIYRGYAIYQASFGDGGTQLNLVARPFFPEPLGSQEIQRIKLKGEINKKTTIDTLQGKYILEFEDFKKFNVFPNEDKNISKQFVNYGASIVFKARDESGQAREFVNYMSPIKLEGRYFYLTGMRETVSDDFKYLHIPVDANATMERFFKFHAILNDDKRILQMAMAAVDSAVSNKDKNNAQMQQKVATAMVRLVGLFRKGGYVAIDNDIQSKVPKDKQPAIAKAYMGVLQTALENMYLLVLREEGIDVNKGISDTDGVFFEDAVSALAGLGFYGTPFYLELVDFEHREASGLQIARAPGKNIVYLGCLLLIIGIFMMFYIAQQRFWLMVVKAEGAGKMELIFAGSTNRNEFGFNKRYRHFAEQLKALLLDYK